MTFPMNLGALIARGEGGDRGANTLAIIGLDDGFNERQYTFAELDALADAVASTLAAQYVRGERIALLGANSADYVATMLGIMRAGLVAVPVNYKFPRALIADVIADSGARLVFTDSQRVGDAPATLPRVVFNDGQEEPGAQGFQSFIAESNARGQTFEPVVPHEKEAALFLYTSGSTGRPKGVVLSHASHLWVVETRLKAQPLSGERI